MSKISTYTNANGVTHDDSTDRFNTDQLIKDDQNDFRGWKCEAGQSFLFIKPNGEMYRSICKINGSLGNVYSEYTIPEEPITCTVNRCNCSHDIRIPKRQNND